MYVTQCPVCLSDLAINERKVVRFAEDGSSGEETIFTCLICGSDVVGAWIPQPRRPAGWAPVDGTA